MIRKCLLICAAVAGAAALPIFAAADEPKLTQEQARGLKPPAAFTAGHVKRGRALYGTAPTGFIASTFWG